MLKIDWLDEFKSPPAHCGQVMFWIWNGEVNERRITEMLEGFTAHGIGGMFVHSRTGLLTEYLSDRWFELWEHSLKESVRLGLECHIYDEDGFPSGPAGGKTLESFPQGTFQWLSVTRHPGAPVETKGKLVAAWRLDAAPGTLTPLPEGADLSAAVREGEVVTATWRGLEGDAHGVDLCLPGVTDAFLRVTHDEYAKHFSSYFGKEIRYSFTDEPGTNARRGLPVSQHMLDEFRKEHGYDLLPKFGALLVEGPESASVRYDYWETMNRLFCINWGKAYYDWCEAHGIGFTGHYWEHEWPSPAQQPDVMALYRWQQVPGIDMLAFQFDSSGRLKNSLYLPNLKEISSVAAQLGRKRVLCETYGGGGYNWALQQFKPLSDWCLVYGVNIVDPHLSYQTLIGHRKYDWPQTITDHSPWYPCYHMQAMHDRRAVCALLKGEERNRVLLLHPTASAWLHFVPDGYDLGANLKAAKAGLEALRESQCAVVQALADGQVDYDLGDEWVMEEFGSVREGRLAIGEREYSLVILPPNMETCLPSTVELLRKYLDAGGRVLALGEPPALVRGHPDDAPAGLAREHAQGWERVEDLDALVSRARKLVPPRVSSPDGCPLPADLVCRREEMDGGRVLYFFASPFLKEIDEEVLLDGASLLLLDTMTGKARQVPTEPAGSGQVLALRLPPGGSALYVADPTRSKAPAPRPRSLRPIKLGEPTALRLEPNVLTVDYCDLELRGRRWADIVTVRADGILRKENGLPIRYGVDGVEPAPVEQPLAPEGGFAVTYHFRAKKEALAELELAVEQPWLYRVEVNGRAVEFRDEARWFDEGIRKAPIGEFARTGENTVTLVAPEFSRHTEIAPVYVLGEFSVRAASPGFVLGAPKALGMGDWLKQGLLFYPWGVRYAMPFSLRAQAAGIALQVLHWQGSAMRVKVDGKLAGDVAYPPYVLEANARLKPGRHTLEIDLFGNLKNMMGPPFSEALPIIWAWTNAPAHQPDGKRYRFYSCGLKTAPTLSVW
jgi:hypothetical protein